MHFLNTWAIGLGVAAAALPVIVHLLTRPRPVRLPLSTLRFVREAVRQRRARHRLRDWLVLALRTLAVLALAGAIARPLGNSRPPVAASESAATTRVVVLDVSQSMGAVRNGIQAIEQARSAAARHLEFSPGLNANLILAGAAPLTTFNEPSTNFGALRDELARCASRPQRLNVKAAIDAAARMLAEGRAASASRRELVIVSDFQRSNWATVDLSVLPADTHIELESVAPLQTPANLAITKVGWQGRAALDRDMVLEVEIGNFSATPQTVQVQLDVGRSAYRMQGTCPSRSRTTLTKAVPLRAPGWHNGQARLVGVSDALEADNVRSLVVDVHSAPQYALISRQKAEERATSSYFIERALVPRKRRTATAGDAQPGAGVEPAQADGGGKNAASAHVLRIDSAQIDREALAKADLIVLDHPGRLPETAPGLLATLLRRGRPLLYVASEPIDAVNLRLLREAAGSEMQLPVEFAPAPSGQPRRELFLAEFDRQQAPFREFGDSLDTLLGQLRFSGGLASRQVEGMLADDVLATFSDRSAALVVVPCGAGTLAVLNADLGASNLPVSPAFVPLVAELVERLLDQRRQGGSEFASGEPLTAYLPAEAGPAAGLTVMIPLPTKAPRTSGKSSQQAVTKGEFVDEGIQALWRMPAAGPPGVYQVLRDRATVFAIACVVPAEESDLTPLSSEVLEQRLAGGRQVSYRSAASAGDERDDSWVWLLVICVVCGLAELITLRVFKT